MTNIFNLQDNNKYNKTLAVGLKDGTQHFKRAFK